MKWTHKSKLPLPSWSRTMSVADMFTMVVVLVLVTVTKQGFAQRYYPYHHHRQYQHPSVWSNPGYKQYSYQFMPSVRTSAGSGFLSGSRIVGAVKSYPLHSSSLSSSFGGSSRYTPSSSPFISSAGSHPVVTYYSGPNHGSHKSHSSPYSVSSPGYSSSPYYRTSSPTTVTTMTSPSSHAPSLFASFGRPSSPPQVTSYSQAPFLPSRNPPGPLSGASMETYKEALDLFSEVVHKLEKDTGNNGFGSNFPQQSTPLSNGIYDSPNGRLPYHLDHIMGPDFLQRAHKLYNKIIKEQSYNRIAPSSSSSGYFPSSASRGHPTNGLSYFEGAIQPDGGTYDFPRSSPYARNMALDRIDPPDSTLERSLLDTVRSIEMGMAKEREIQPFTDDLMETSESRMVPREMNLVSAIDKHIHSQMLGNSPTSTAALPSPSPTTQLSADPTATFYSTTSTATPSLSGSIVPLNKNDFIEHPLPFNEYAQLIQDIATNPNY